uniref:Methyltransferase domain-containing protein n=1 Tax=Globisporangium ultimum (strain ATCC 200006 / CBS 805.95 / DAOM BR144) TaxID=431595 RepID=K3WRR4_GLOUD
MPSTSAFAAIAANVSKSKSSTLAVMPLVVACAAVTGYARSTAAAHHMQAAPQENDSDAAHDAETFHQHVVYQTGSVTVAATLMLAPRKTLHSTPLRVFQSALEMLRIASDDVFYDIGCGDGRLVIAAARTYSIRAVGIEIDAVRAAQATRAVQDAGVAHLVTIHHGNAMDFDYRDATVMFLFLIERGLGLIRPLLEQLPSRCRVVTYLYKFPGSLPHEGKHFLRAKDASDDVAFPVYIYTFPSRFAVENGTQSAL